MSIVTDRPTLSTRVNPAAFASVRWEIVVVAVSAHSTGLAIKECHGRILNPVAVHVGKRVAATNAQNYPLTGPSRYRQDEPIGRGIAKDAGTPSVGAAK